MSIFMSGFMVCWLMCGASNLIGFVHFCRDEGLVLLVSGMALVIITRLVTQAFLEYRK
jgi:hypothetical protein